MSAVPLDPVVREHFRDFYDGPPADDRALLVVIGNCQAESLRLMLAGPDIATVRLPAIHELTADDLAPLHRLLDRAGAVAMQPVVDDYRGLPLGTAQLFSRLAADVPRAIMPSVRFTGLYPHHVLVHPPGLDEVDPPLVAYHDLRTVVTAAWLATGADPPPVPTLTPAIVRAVADESVAQLRLREARHDTVVVSDLIDRTVTGGVPFTTMRTINHPGNTVLERVAERLRAALGLAPHEPDVRRQLLDRVHAPRDPVVATVLDPGAEPRETWLVDGVALQSATVTDAHLEWYAARPSFVAEALRRSRDTLDLLGLQAPR